MHFRDYPVDIKANLSFVYRIPLLNYKKKLNITVAGQETG